MEDRGRERVEHGCSVTSSGRLVGIGIILVAALVICSRSNVGTPVFLVSLGVAAVAYLLALRECFRTQRLSRQVLFACLALAVLWRIPFLLTPPGGDDDIHRYVWDGRVQRLGYSPYLLIPADAANAWMHTPETRGLNNPDVPSPYPAGAQLFFRMVVAIHESIFLFKVAFLLCDAAIVLLLIYVLRRSGRGEHWVLAYAWHPLLATNVAGSGHIDIVGTLLLSISVAALVRRWRAIAAIAFALAVGVKFLPIVLAPLYWRRLRIRDWLLVPVVLAVLYVPFLNGWRVPTGSLATYVRSFRFNDPVFAALEQVARPQVVAGLAVLVGLLTATWLRRKTSLSWDDQWAWPMAATLAMAPVVYPWYLLWLLPFLGSMSSLPLIVWTVSILPTYIVWHFRTLGRPWQVPTWVLLLEYGAVAVSAAAVLLRRKTKLPIVATPEESGAASFVRRVGSTRNSQ